MTQRFLYAFACMWAIGWSASASAQDAHLVSYNDLLSRIETLEAERASYRTYGACDTGCDAGCCDEACCDEACCEVQCDPCNSCGVWYGMYESVCVKPVWDRNAAFSVELNDNDGGVDLDEGADVVEFDYDLNQSNRFEIGYLAAAGNLGWRARYWHFQDSTTISVSDADAFLQTRRPGLSLDGDIQVNVTIVDDPEIEIEDADAIVTYQSIKVDVIDLETVARRGMLTYSAGVRYARFKQSYLADDPDGTDEEIYGNLSFRGLGPTLALEARQPVLRTVNLSLFGALRGSMLFGERNFHAQEDPDGDPDELYFADNDNDFVGMAELQLGLEWQQGNLFLRGAFEGQYWNGIGQAASQSISGTNEASDPLDQNLGFMGFTLGGGVTY